MKLAFKAIDELGTWMGQEGPVSTYGTGLWTSGGEEGPPGKRGWTRAHSGILGQPPFSQTKSLHHIVAGKGKGSQPREPEWVQEPHGYQRYHSHPWGSILLSFC